MSKLNTLVLVLLSTIITGCTTLSQHQSECEQKYQHFVDMVKCLKSAILNDKYMANNSSIQLYLAYANALADRVNQGTMTDTDAKLALAQLAEKQRIEAQQEAERRSAAINATLQSLAAYEAATRPVFYQPAYMPITCHQIGSFITCN